MGNEKKRPEFRLLILITTPKLAEKAIDLFEKGRVPVQYQFHAQGTAPSEIMEVLGLGSVEKNVLICMLPKPFANEMLKKLKKGLRLGSSNSGVAFTMPLSGGSGKLINMLQTFHEDNTKLSAAILERKVIKMSDCNYVLILAIVNQGYSQDVMSAARPAGAGGGTVFNTRKLVDEDTMKFWGLSVQQEREIVAIIADAENKLTIMQAISKNCGVHSEAHGLVISMPVDSVIGLED